MTEMVTWSLLLAISFAFLDWASTWKGWKIRLYISKPATLFFLIVWTFQLTGWQGGMLWFGIALIFSLIGDIALMLNPRFFLIGLFAFLFAHLGFLVGFFQQPLSFTLGTILLLLLVSLSAARIFKTLKPGLLHVPRGKRFLAAVSIYGLTLACMVFSALSTFFRPNWSLQAATIASMGAILFYASDTLLGYDRFVKKVKHGQSYVHLTYHLGQFCLVTGAMFHFIK